jgi:two-component system C4-dicarboxylate transport response regulator DctD
MLADFRLIASTPLTLPDLLDRNSLREDLFHRLSSITLRIPPLRERREDIPVLFAKFVRDALEQTGKRRFEMNAADRKRLLEHDWPGNARELRNYVFGAVLNLPRQSLSPQAALGTKDLATRVGEFERMLITETLESTGGNVVRACALLGTPRKTLYEKLSRLQIDPGRFRSVQAKR